MKNLNIPIILFTIFAFGLPIWAMNNNEFPQTSVHDCKGDCYSNWQEETGGVVQVLADQQAARAAASPAELGKEKYIGCVACHGAGGEGGVGPALNNQTAVEIADKLMRYKNGETIGGQSSLMWSQASMLSNDDIDNLAAYIESL